MGDLEKRSQIIQAPESSPTVIPQVPAIRGITTIVEQTGDNGEPVVVGVINEPTPPNAINVTPPPAETPKNP